MRHIGLQPAIMALQEGELKYSSLQCPNMNLMEAVTPGGSHIPAIDPYHYLYATFEYGRLRRSVRTILHRGSTGVEELAVDAMSVEVKQNSGPALLLAAYYEAALNTAELPDQAKSNKSLLMVEAEKLGATCGKGWSETFNGLVNGSFLKPFGHEPGTLEDTLRVQPIIHLAGPTLTLTLNLTRTLNLRKSVRCSHGWAAMFLAPSPLHSFRLLEIIHSYNARG